MPRSGRIDGGQGRVYAGAAGGYRLEAPPWPSPLCVCGHPRFSHFCAFARCDLCSCRFFELEKVPA
jgi:hypothetical protein